MFNFLNPEAASPTPRQIAHSLRWLGWIGFWLQALLGFIPILVVVASVLFSPGRQRSGLSFGLGLAIACLVILLFSIYWCFRYTQLANKLESPNLRPAKSQVSQNLKLGLLANIGIMAIAVLIALSQVGTLTFKMLMMPQGSTMITPNQTATMVTQGAIITPSNMIAIQAMVNAIAAGLVGAIVALLLLYQVGQHRHP
ncbi:MULTISPECIES: DUF3611 family protein [unclassified Nodularia (in: cyanobacteria)]|uniref:DUF3611 family protein n=1 Tax=unclassified Nodularia (in: cyanobacteria) TaxID=2656917 RepID=UPI00187E23D0|nr:MULTISPECIES: DUF3611 family protein [unclassified Nodularia (in: cyanobacteria)]MBE9200496.1 DUF3611 family protein [Nodularia sp. LEGE 06071]MCC2691204.1 DUF3611 family protein [Nodularia sp. LEGE 04288]